MTDFLALDSLSVSLAIAFAFGMGARVLQMPPMLGFLAAGFVLSQLGVEPSEAGRRIADFGVLLLLFTIGLKLKPRMLAEKQVLAASLGHMSAAVLLLFGLLLGLGGLGFGLLAGLGPGEAALIAFALSFSSTVFTVKIYEEKGELGSVHGKIALGILIIQDIAAVVYLTASTGALPSVWAIGLLVLLGLRPVLTLLLDRIGHDELLPLFGLVAVLVLGAATFKAVGLKPDLGALFMGMLMAGQRRASEVADALLSFKDIFLIGFFLNIGLGGIPSTEVIVTALVLVALLPLKAALFFGIFVWLRLRARTALLGALGLATYSEFGLIVGAVAVSQGLLSADWLLVLALALAISFLLLTPVNAAAHDIYARFSRHLRRYEARTAARADQRPIIGQSEVVIFGMGRLGQAVYRTLEARLGRGLVGVETDWEKVRRMQLQGWNVVHGDATDSDFWLRAVRPSAQLRAVLLAMPDHEANMYALEQIRGAGFPGFVAAMARFPEDLQALRDAGAHVAFDVYGEAGAGFATDIAEHIAPLPAGAEGRREAGVAPG
ncbi:cation:proton antiporter [Paralimibaculum aggregatum]|uniref:Cation:proton antiporter n=1 Tax=Paralimibaculum aggregatum TaxID=3036245 RepID=A0ABQ6LDM9_9RHOB|nr:cation:proton antiporter family protein [Limibaculum sp. NKW23]GMG81452.1 cation:proton antiporter [Limibaculum sp. NKW23]